MSITYFEMQQKKLRVYTHTHRGMEGWLHLHKANKANPEQLQNPPG